jgi:hypothetical protein
MRGACTTSWSPFPPRTREAQLDEKWAFVAKKEARCDPDQPADGHEGDRWDHVALDPGHRLIVSVVTGKRAAENTDALARDFHRRTLGRLMDLITTDESAKTGPGGGGPRRWGRGWPITSGRSRSG